MSNHRCQYRRLLFTFVAIGLAAPAASVFAQSMPADLNPESGARLPYLTRQDFGAEGQRISDIFARGDGAPTDPVSGPLAFAAYNIPVANALLDLHDGAVTQGTLDPHVRELAILVACRETNYTLEWNGHVQAALNAGVDQSVIDVVKSNRPLSGLSDQDAAVIRFGRELLGDRQMTSQAFAKAVDHFGDHGAMDLVAVMSTYAVSGFYAIAVDEHPPGTEILVPVAH
jgi:4-carboxymuconolactone decarboxylase